MLKLAANVAIESENRFPMGAVVVSGGRVISVGTNRRTNDPAYVPYEYCSTHAEVRALKKAGYPRGVKIYVARVMADGSTGLARPCEACYDLIDDLSIKAIWTT